MFMIECFQDFHRAEMRGKFSWSVFKSNAKGPNENGPKTPVSTEMREKRG